LERFDLSHSGLSATPIAGCALIRAALATRSTRLCATILAKAEANAAATALGACIGSLRGDQLAIGLVDGVDGHVVGLAVCA
jgi:hypothetical protein